MDDIADRESNDTIDRMHSPGTEDVDTQKGDSDPLSDDIIPTLASALLSSGETLDIANFAVSAGMSGPLPPPWILEGYNETIPDGANRIMTMAETGQAAMIADRKEQRRAERRAQIFAFICVLAILGTGIVLMVIGQVVAGLLLSCPGLAAVVYAFVRVRD